jgi:hypothetical protein
LNVLVSDVGDYSSTFQQQQVLQRGGLVACYGDVPPEDLTSSKLEQARFEGRPDPSTASIARDPGFGGSIRDAALGRKNWLFAGSDAGGERAAAIHSLLGSAKLSGIDPELYLRALLECIAEHPINRIDELLPWNLAAAAASNDRLAA